MRSSNAPLKTTHSLLRPGHAWIFVGVVLAACSSAPEPPDSVVTVKNRAARYTEFGNDHFARGHLDQALQFFQLALTENNSVDNLAGTAKSHNSIARVHLAAERYEKAAHHAGRAIHFAELADASNQLMHAHIIRGEVFLRMNAVDAALDSFQAAETTAEAAGLSQDPVLLHNLGALYARRESFERAIEYLDRARTINTDAENWTELGSNYFMLASVASRRGDYDDALSLAQRALESDKRAEHSPGIAADLDAIGRIYLRRGEDDRAILYLERALNVYLSIDRPRESAEILERLATAAERSGDGERAAEYRRRREVIREVPQ